MRTAWIHRGRRWEATAPPPDYTGRRGVGSRRSARHLRVVLRVRRRRGFDANDNAVTPAGNTETGPFRVAGAEPGDTLAVDLEQIRPMFDPAYTMVCTLSHDGLDTITKAR